MLEQEKVGVGDLPLVRVLKAIRRGCWKAPGSWSKE